jgi:hypothetical protein
VGDVEGGEAGGDAGVTDEAERLFREALALRMRHLGEENPATAQCRLGLAALLRRRGELEEARREATAAFEALGRALPPEHPDVVSAQRELDRPTGEPHGPDQTPRV